MTTALLFSGQGAQQVGMGLSLYNNIAEAKKTFDLANEILGYDLKKICFEGPEIVLTEAQYCQPALFVHGYSLYQVLKNNGKLEQLHAVLGLSLGELTAMAVAGVYDFETGLKIVAERGRLMQEACNQTEGGMACLIGGSRESIQALCDAFDVDMANLNCPGQIVISGEKSKIKAAAQKAEGMEFKRVIPLNVAGAYHSRLMKSAQLAFESFLKDITFSKPTLTVFTNTTGQAISQPQAIKTALGKQIVDSVRWEACMRAAIELGINDFYECGPGNILAGLAKRIDKTVQVTPVGEFENIPSAVN